VGIGPRLLCFFYAELSREVHPAMAGGNRNQSGHREVQQAFTAREEVNDPQNTRTLRVRARRSSHDGVCAKEQL
jgi:hypothetical protein